MRVDVHQHVWTEPLLEALAARRSLPFVERSGGRWILHSAGEHPYPIEVAGESPERRRAWLRSDGLDAAIVAISTPIGIEALPRVEARALIDAHLAGVGALGAEFAAWGPLALDGAGPGDVDGLLDRGCVGISLAAGALYGPEALDRLSPVLDRLAARAGPLFVHPGPGAGSPRPEASASEPGWWQALTSYVAQMQAAWLTFATAGRTRYPELVVVFSMLAGGAPLLAERLATRGGPAVDVRDPATVYDTSSYGPLAVTALAECVGSAQLVYGSDRPVLEPLATEHDDELKARGAQFLVSPA
jgi:hypothetical protein